MFLLRLHFIIFSKGTATKAFWKDELENFHRTSPALLRESQPAKEESVQAHLLSFAYWKDLRLSAY